MKPFLCCDADINKIQFPVLVLPKIASSNLNGCFSRNAMVITNLGLLPIGDIVDKKLQVKALSYNESTGDLEFKRVVNYFNNGSKRGLSFRGDNVTADHEVFDGDTWVRADTATENCIIDNTYSMSVFIGMLLGDSVLSIEKREGGKGAYRLTWSNTEKDIEYGHRKADLFSDVANVNTRGFKSGYGSNCINFCTSKLNELGFEPWVMYNTNPYKENYTKRKVDLEHKDIAKWFTDLSLAIWYLDDGYLAYNNGNRATPRIHFSIARYSEKSQETFKRLFLNKYGVTPVIAKYGKDVRMSFTSAESVYLLWRMSNVAGGLLPRKFPESMQTDILPDRIQKVTLKKIPSVIGNETSSAFISYDIEVEDNHNYFCNGLLVHKCCRHMEDLCKSQGNLIGRGIVNGI